MRKKRAYRKARVSAPPLTGRNAVCYTEQKKDTAMLTFYFTGTGNSLAAAKKIGGTLISIPQAVHAAERTYRDDAIGFVFPLYCLNPPKMVREFLQNTKFEANYIFAVATYGNAAGAAPAHLHRAAERLGFRLDYMNALLSVDNCLPYFEMGEEVTRLPAKRTEECLQQIVSDIAARKRFIPGATAEDEALSAYCEPLLREQDKGESAKAFIVNEKCTRCCLCTYVCPAGNISVAERVEFGNRCEACFACIHACPQGAIHLPNERSAARWRNPDVSVTELIRANSQNEI